MTIAIVDAYNDRISSRPAQFDSHYKLSCGVAHRRVQYGQTTTPATSADWSLDCL